MDIFLAPRRLQIKFKWLLLCIQIKLRLSLISHSTPFQVFIVYSMLQFYLTIIQF